MGIWDLINSTTEACKTSYGYCYSAGGKIVNAVRSNSQRVSNYIPDQETRSQIGLFAFKFAENSAKYALQESYKSVPGGKAFAEIVTKTMHDVKSENQRRQEMQALEETTAGGNVKNSSMNVPGKVELQSSGLELGHEKANQSPEEVLRIFLTQEFMGKRFADELLLPQIKYVKEKTSK